MFKSLFSYLIKKLSKYKCPKVDKNFLMSILLEDLRIITINIRIVL